MNELLLLCSLFRAMIVMCLTIRESVLAYNHQLQLNLSKCKASVAQNFCTYRATGMLKINNLVALQVQNFWTTEALHLDRFNCIQYIESKKPYSKKRSDLSHLNEMHKLTQQDEQDGQLTADQVD